MKALWLIMLILIIALQYRLWFDRNSIPENHKLEQLIEQQKEENQTLKERNEALRLVTSGLVSDPFFIEGHARQNLGMIKEGETLFLVFDDTVDIAGSKPEKPEEEPELDPNYQFPPLPEPRSEAEATPLEVKLQ